MTGSAHAPPQTRCWSWFTPDPSIGFWVRRMMQETVVRRADVELASGAAARLGDEVALNRTDTSSDLQTLAMMRAGVAAVTR